MSDFTAARRILRLVDQALLGTLSVEDARAEDLIVERSGDPCVRLSLRSAGDAPDKTVLIIDRACQNAPDAFPGLLPFVPGMASTSIALRESSFLVAIATGTWHWRSRVEMADVFGIIERVTAIPFPAADEHAGAAVEELLPTIDPGSGISSELEGIRNQERIQHFWWCADRWMQQVNRPLQWTRSFSNGASEVVVRVAGAGVSGTATMCTVAGPSLAIGAVVVD